MPWLSFRLLNPRKGTETPTIAAKAQARNPFRLLNPRKGTETCNLPRVKRPQFNFPLT